MADDPHTDHIIRWLGDHGMTVVRIEANGDLVIRPIPVKD